MSRRRHLQGASRGLARTTGQAIVLAVCVANAIASHVLQADERPMPMGANSPASLKPSLHDTAPDQAMHDFGIMGEVARPGVYRLPAGTVRLVDLVQIAGGATDRAAGNARILRSGRNSQQAFIMPGEDAMLYPGDIVVLSESLTKSESASAATDGVTTVGYSAEAAPLRPAGERKRFVQLAYVGLYDHPVIAKLAAQEATLAKVVHSLNQPPEAADSVRLVQTVPQRRLAAQQSKDIQLASGSILIFDQAALAVDRLPRNVPQPVNCTATGSALNDPAASSVPDTAMQDSTVIPRLHSAAENAVPPAPIDDELLELPPNAGQQAPSIEPNAIAGDSQKPEMLAPNAIAPAMPGPSVDEEPSASRRASVPPPGDPASDNAAELPQWPAAGGTQRSVESGLAAPPAVSSGPPAAAPLDASRGAQETTQTPSAAGPQRAPLAVQPVPADNASASATEQVRSDSAPRLHREGDDPSTHILPHVLPAKPVEAKTLPTTIGASHEAADAEEAALNDAAAAENLVPTKGRSIVRIKFPGTNGISISADLFIVGGLGLVAALVALLTMVPAGRNLISSPTETAIAENEAPEAEIEAPAARPEPISATEHSLDDLINNELPVVEEPCQLKSNLTFYGRASVRSRNRLDSGHPSAIPHVQSTTVAGNVSRQSYPQSDSISRGEPDLQRETTESRQRAAARSPGSGRSDLLDRALSNIEGGRS